jgi:uncharacterized protein (TIGR03435 family)
LLLVSILMICLELSAFRELVVLVIGPLALCVPFVRCQQDTVSSHSGAQSDNAIGSTPTYDVTLVKPAKEDGPGEINFVPDGLQAMNSSPEDLLRVAYHLQNIDGLIVGTPKWARTRLFDVQGKVVGPDVAKVRGLNIDQRRLMLQALLADRFKLQAHLETRNGSVYALMIAAGGSKLKPSNPKDNHPTNGGGRGHLAIQDCSMLCLSTVLSQHVGRPVVDKTGLTGNYDTMLDWTPDEGGSIPSAGGGSQSPALPPDSIGTSIFTAIQEQLGLKLRSTEGPVRVLVVDQIEPPSVD